MEIPRNGWQLLTVACFLWVGYAQANLLTNGSFEHRRTFIGDGNRVDELSSGSTVIPGWTTTNGVPTAWIENGNPYGISASDGSFFLDLTGYANFGTYGGVTQTMTGLAVGTTYALTFDLGYGGNSSLFGGPVTVRVTRKHLQHFHFGIRHAEPGGVEPARPSVSRRPRPRRH